MSNRTNAKLVTMRFVVWLFLAGLIISKANLVFSQNYPEKPIRIMTSAAGGGADIAARSIAQGLTNSLGQQVVVDNRGGEVVAITVAASAPPDGYTLLCYSSAMWFAPLLKDVPYDPVRDFSPISLADKSPNILVVSPTLPVKSVKELIVLARARPGELNYGSSGRGSSNHLAAELFKAMAGVNMVFVNYKGAALAVSDLIGGHVQVMFATPGQATPHVKSGRLRALASTSLEPSALLPGLPTVAASGLPGYQSEASHALFAPVNTPAGIVKLLNQEIVQILNRAEVKKRFLDFGIEVVGSSPEQLATTIKSEMTRMNKVIRDAGIRAE